MNAKKRKITLLFGLGFIIAGVLLNSAKIGTQEYLGFSSAGTWMMYIGFVTLLITAIKWKVKERKVDERINYIAAKANRITFIAVMVAAFLVMVIDGVYPINMRYGMFMSYVVMFMIIIYSVSYKIIERRN